MLHKVSELTGVRLDAAVAKADGWEFTDTVGEGRKPPVLRHGVMVPQRVLPGDARNESGFEHAGRFHPSGDWSHGGPIIERELIGLEPMPGWGLWSAAVGGVSMDGPIIDPDGTGPTPLIAAMRAYVASKFGETVELP